MKLNNWLRELIKPKQNLLEVEKVVNKIEFVETEVPVTKLEVVETEVPVVKVEKINNDVIINHIEIVETEVPVTKIEVVETEVPVVKIETVETEIPITKIETITVEKPVFDEQTPSKLNELIHQLEKVMGLRDLFKSKTTEFDRKYEILLNTIEVMNSTVQQLTQTVESQQNVIINLNNTKIKGSKNVETVVETITVENPINVELQEKIIQLNETRIQLESRLKETTSPVELQRVKDAYYGLLQFCFENLNPTTDFEPSHAKKYWEDLIK